MANRQETFEEEFMHSVSSQIGREDNAGFKGNNQKEFYNSNDVGLNIALSRLGPLIPEKSSLLKSPNSNEKITSIYAKDPTSSGGETLIVRKWKSDRDPGKPQISSHTYVLSKQKLSSSKNEFSSDESLKKTMKVLGFDGDGTEMSMAEGVNQPCHPKLELPGACESSNNL